MVWRMWFGMVCGVVRCDVMWCGVVWCDVVCMVWCDVVWYGMVWRGVVWYDVTWCGMVWCNGCGVVWYDVVWYGEVCMVWCDVVWYSMVWRGVVWYDMMWYCLVYCGVMWYGMVWYDMMVWYTLQPFLLFLTPILLRNWNSLLYFHDLLFWVYLVLIVIRQLLDKSYNKNFNVFFISVLDLVMLFRTNIMRHTQCCGQVTKRFPDFLKKFGIASATTQTTRILWERYWIIISFLKPRFVDCFYKCLSPSVFKLNTFNDSLSIFRLLPKISLVILLGYTDEHKKVHLFTFHAKDKRYLQNQHPVPPGKVIPDLSQMVWYGVVWYNTVWCGMV